MTEETLDSQMLGQTPSGEDSPLEPTYPGLGERLRASAQDGFATIVFMFIAAVVFSFFEDASDNARMWTVISIFFIYDPLFTSLFGGTIGHRINGIRVKREKNETKNIAFPLALIRFAVKAGLGCISLFTVGSNKKRKAIHDMMVRSVVVYHKKD